MVILSGFGPAQRANKTQPSPAPSPFPTQSGPPRIQDTYNQNQGLGGVYTDVNASPDPKVYWGAAYNGRNLDETILTVDQAIAKATDLSEPEIFALGARLYRAGVISDPTNLKAILSGWTDIVKIAAGYYTGSNRKITPWEVLDIQEGVVEQSGTVGGGYTGPASRDFKNKTFSIPTNAEADAVTRQMFQNLVGRDPDKAELGRYRSLLVSKAKQNPSITTRTETYDSYGAAVDTTTTQSGGFTQAMAEDSVRQKTTADPEYGAYQAATSYMNTLLQAIGSP